MFFIYNIFLIIILLFSPIITIIRIILGKEDQDRFKEKYGFLAKKISLIKQFGYMVQV